MRQQVGSDEKVMGKKGNRWKRGKTTQAISYSALMLHKMYLVNYSSSWFIFDTHTITSGGITTALAAHFCVGS